MAAAKTPSKKKAVTAVSADVLNILAKAREHGKKYDVAPISLAKGGYVSGALSFGALSIDLVTGGGLPPARFTTVSGPSMSGKSTLTYQTAACANELGIPVLYLDHESSADAKYLTALGVKLFDDNGDQNPLFIYSQPSSGEPAYRYIHQLLSDLPDKNTSSFAYPQLIIAIDSLAAMLPEDEDENPDKSQMAGPAKVHAWGLRLIKSLLSRKNVSLMATNQLRQKPGVVYGNPEYEPGGQAILFYPDLKLQVRGTGKSETERGRGMRNVNVNTMKNKQFPPFMQLKDELNIAFGYGFDRYYDGYCYLKKTGQIEFVRAGKNTGYKVRGLGYGPIEDKLVPTADFVRELFKNEFREACRKQMLTGEAFNKLFATMNWSDMYAFDPERSGIDMADVEPAPVSDDEAAAAAAAMSHAADLAAELSG